MTTVRLQIVDAIATALAAATGLTVHRNLDYALEDTNLPVLALMSGDDAPTEAPGPLGVLDQTALLDIAVLVAHSENPEAAADPYEAQIHAALFAATEFAGFGVLMDRLGGGWAFDLGDCAARSLRYRVGYRTSFTSLES